MFKKKKPHYHSLPSFSSQENDSSVSLKKKNNTDIENVKKKGYKIYKTVMV
jgi:hypothetical protein